MERAPLPGREYHLGGGTAELTQPLCWPAGGTGSEMWMEHL